MQVVKYAKTSMSVLYQQMRAIKMKRVPILMAHMHVTLVMEYFVPMLMSVQTQVTHVALKQPAQILLGHLSVPVMMDLLGMVMIVSILTSA